MPAAYDGGFIFGRSVSVVMAVNPSEKQVSSFFGVHGTFSLFGGSRGRAFFVAGVLYGANRAGVDAARDLLLSYDDGIQRVFVDTGGVAWPFVEFEHWEQAGGYGYGHGGLLLPYRAAFSGRL